MGLKEAVGWRTAMACIALGGLLFGCETSQPRETGPVPRRLGSPRVQAPHRLSETVRMPSMHVTLEPVPENVDPAVGARAALHIATEHGWGKPSSVERTLVLYSREVKRLEDGSSRFVRKDKLAWIVTLHGVCVPSFGPVGGPCADHTTNVVINATNGNIIGEYSHG